MQWYPGFHIERETSHIQNPHLLFHQETTNLAQPLLLDQVQNPHDAISPIANADCTLVVPESERLQSTTKDNGTLSREDASLLTMSPGQSLNVLKRRQTQNKNTKHAHSQQPDDELMAIPDKCILGRTISQDLPDNVKEDEVSSRLNVSLTVTDVKNEI
jgi:hypothetical protein